MQPYRRAGLVMALLTNARGTVLPLDTPRPVPTFMTAASRRFCRHVCKIA